MKKLVWRNSHREEKMRLQRLYSYIRQAVDDFEMIEEGDKIAIGISGGKDSLTLLYGLSGLQKFYPKKFELVAITVDLGYENYDVSKIKALCEQLGVAYYVVDTQIADMLAEGQCSLCARLRKGAFNNKAKELGCNKFAYAHNLDDVVETVLLSLMYEGRFSTFWPVTDIEGLGMKLIRPMIYTPVTDIKGFQYKYDLPVSKNPCPYESKTQRHYARELLQEMHMHAPGVKKRILTAVMDGTIPEWKIRRKK